MWQVWVTKKVSVGNRTGRLGICGEQG